MLGLAQEGKRAAVKVIRVVPCGRVRVERFRLVLSRALLRKQEPRAPRFLLPQELTMGPARPRYTPFEHKREATQQDGRSRSSPFVLSPSKGEREGRAEARPHFDKLSTNGPGEAGQFKRRTNMPTINQLVRKGRTPQKLSLIHI